MEKHQRQVIHLYLKEKQQHHYFGSIPAMFENYSSEELGVAQQSLYNRWKVGEWENDMVILRKGRLVTTKK